MDLDDRVMQFKCLELPGQPMMMHMGTSYLVNDLYTEVKRLRAERDAMAAHVEYCHKVLSMVENGPSYLVARQYRALRMARERKPTTSLARLKAQWQAEALEEEADSIMAEAGYLEPFRQEVAGRLRYQARLRHQAEAKE